MSLTRRAVTGFVTRSDDARLERVFGTRRGLRFLFGRMARAYVPAAGAEGDLCFVLPDDARGAPRAWTVRCDAAGAEAHPGRSADPRLVLRLGVPSLVRIAVGEVDPGRALLDGRLDVEGDAGVLERLGAMFGRPGAGTT